MITSGAENIISVLIGAKIYITKFGQLLSTIALVVTLLSMFVYFTETISVEKQLEPDKYVTTGYSN